MMMYAICCPNPRTITRLIPRIIMGIWNRLTKTKKIMPMDLVLKPSCSDCGSTVELYESTCYDCGAPLTRLNRIEDDISPLISPKKEDRVYKSSPLKSTTLDRKRKRNDEESKGTDGTPLDKAKTQNEVKSVTEEPNSSKSGSAPPSGPVTEDEVRALLQEKPMTVRDFALTFHPRVKTEREKDAFGDILKRITRLQKNGASVSENLMFLREIEDDISPVVAPKKVVPREEPVDNSSSLKSSSSGADRGTPSTANSSKGKIINNGGESEATNEVKSVKDEPTSSTKSNAPTKCASPPASSRSGSAPPSGPITEAEVRALLQGRKPMTLRNFTRAFYPRVKTKRDEDAFAAIVKRITRQQKNGASVSENLVFLREIEDDISPVVTPKEEVPRKEPVYNSSSLKSSVFGADRGTPSTANSSKGKIINNDEESKTINEVKSVKDEPASSTKCNAPTKCASPPASSISKSALSAGPITEDEIRALLQGTPPMTTRDFVLAFESRLKTKREIDAFVDLAARITHKWKIGGEDSEYVLFLRDKTC